MAGEVCFNDMTALLVFCYRWAMVESNSLIYGEGPSGPLQLRDAPAQGQNEAGAGRRRFWRRTRKSRFLQHRAAPMRFLGSPLTLAVIGFFMGPAPFAPSSLRAAEVAAPPPGVGTRPNILLYLTDDQSWLHSSISGEKQVHTPGFDRVAREGILFTNAFAAAPSCAPSRASILTGRYPWQLEEGAMLFGGIPRSYPLISHLLEEAGYESAMSYKGYWPGNSVDDTYHRAPLGKSYHVRLEGDYPKGIADCDYAGSFQKFLDERDPAKPFFFWMGISEPHRIFQEGIGVKSGQSIDSVQVPPFLPDHPIVRSDLLDYFYEINHQDKHLARILLQLEEIGELDNTLIIVTSDNGMPFPRAKTTLYEYGTRVPLAIRWGNVVKSGLRLEDVTNLLHLAPTLLDVAGVEIPESMTGRSLVNLLSAQESGVFNRTDNFTVTAMERHTLARRGGLGYPMRALRTEEWLLIRNFEPTRWPAGDPPPFNPIFYRDYGDTDEGPSKRFIVDNQSDEDGKRYFALSFGKRPEYELYHIPTDVENMHNLALDPERGAVFETLKKQLAEYLLKTGDPRMTGEARFDAMPFYLLEQGPVRVNPESHPHLF